jgi:hypothetical protein
LPPGYKHGVERLRITASPLYQRRMETMIRDPPSMVRRSSLPATARSAEGRQPSIFRRTSLPTSARATQGPSQQDADKSADREQASPGAKSSQRLSGDDAASSGSEQKVSVRRQSKLSAMATTAGGSSDRSAGDSDADSSVEVLQPEAVEKSELVYFEKARQSRISNPSTAAAIDEDASLQIAEKSAHADRLTWTSRKSGSSSSTSATTKQAPSQHGKEKSLPLALECPPSTNARGHSCDLRSEMRLLYDYAKNINSAVEDKGTQFADALSEAIARTSRSGDWEEIHSFCSFQKELKQLQRCAQKLSTIVKDKHLVSDLARMSDVLIEFKLGLARNSATERSSLRRADKSAGSDGDPLIKVARIMDLRFLASEMDHLKKIVRRINAKLEDRAVEEAALLNDAVTENRRAVDRDEILMKFSMSAEAELKWLKECAYTLSVFVENKQVVSDLDRLSDLVKDFQVYLLQRFKERRSI